MSPKKKTPADRAKKELKAAVATLRSELSKAEKRIGKLTSKVGGLESAKAELEKQVAKLTKKLDKARRAVEPEPAVYVEVVETPAAAPAEAVGAPQTPDATWTVAQLRDEVRARGLVGVGTRATKAQLLAVLVPAGD